MQHLSRLLLVFLFWYAGTIYAATYSLPSDIGSGPFSGCSGAGPIYSCGDITIDDEDTVNLTANVTFNMTSFKLDIKSEVTINDNGNSFIINAKDVTIKADSTIDATINATDKVDIKEEATINGDITAKDVVLAEESIVNGNVYASDSLDIKSDAVVNGVCPPWNYSACTGIAMSSPTVVSQTTTDSTPVITGTFTSSVATELTVTVNSVTYTLSTDSELTHTGDDWTLNLSSAMPLTIGLYDVVASSDDGPGNILTDATVDELSIIAPVCNATFRDEFGSISYSNNDGDTNFSGNWDEFEGTSLTVPEASSNPSSGHVLISGGRLVMQNYSPSESSNAPGVEREMDLSGFTSAIFSFDYVTSGNVDNDDSFLVQASANGGTSWTVLENITGINNTSGSKSYDLTPYISSNIKIRLRFNTTINTGACCYGASPETISIDNVNVDASGPCTMIDHFNINVGAGSASTCNPFNISITAEDSSNNPVVDYTGTISISTSTSHGNFDTATATNNTSPNPDNDDNGSVGYTFDVLDNGAITLTLSNEHAETLTISVTDSSIPLTSTSANITFSENAFRITDTDASVAGDDIPVAGRDHSYRIEMVRRDTVTGICGVATGYTGARQLKMWRTKNASDPSPNAPLLDGTSLPAADPGAVNGNITFTNGLADVLLTTSDIGKYTLELADISNLFSDSTIAGTSNEQIVRPFGIGIDFSNLRDADFSDNGAIDDSTGVDLSYASGIVGSVFTQAGEDFSITVEGVLWNAADDADDDGVPDTSAFLGNNTPALSFATEGESVLLTASLAEPVGASTGTLTVDAVAGGLFNSFSSGSQTAVMTYSNVGIINLAASLSDSDYFGSGVDITGSAPSVGRFNPHHYAVTSSTVNSACSVVTPFTYSRQPFTSNVTFRAENKQNTLTDGFRGAFATLDISSELNIRNSATAAAYDQESYTINETFSAGTIGRVQFDVDLTWDMPLQAATVSSVNLINTIDEVTLITGSPFTLGNTEVRFGRLALGNVFGSELLTLSMPMQAEYYDGSNFLFNIDDGCSVLSTADLVLANDVEAGQSDGDIQVQIGKISTATINNNPLLTGDAGLSFCPPGSPACTAASGNVGYIDVQVDLSVSPYLQFDWDNDDGNGDGPYDDNPQARATFGIFNGNSKHIYYRQIYR